MSDFKEYKAAFLEQNDLKHYGVKGMKWGIKTKGTNSSNGGFNFSGRDDEKKKRENALMYQKYPGRGSAGLKDNRTVFNDLKTITNDLMNKNLIPQKQLGPILKLIGKIDQDHISAEERNLCEKYLYDLVTIDRRNNAIAYEEGEADRKAKAEAAKAHLHNHYKKKR